MFRLPAGFRNWLVPIAIITLSAGVSGVAFGQQAPCPPTLCIEDEPCPAASCETGNGASDSYDLGSIPFPISWPVAPNITSEATVSNASELSQSLAVTGRRTILRAGNYGNVSITGSDKELVLEAGANIGFLSINARRIAIRGIPARGHTIRAVHAWHQSNSDLMFNGLSIVSGTTGQDWEEANDLRGTRIAFLHSYIDMIGHAMFMGFGGNSHIIVANTWVRQHRGQQAGPRLHDASNLVFVDSRFENVARHSWRLHIAQGGDARNVVLSRNQFVGSGIQLRPNSGAGMPSTGWGVMEEIWVEDNEWYHDRNVVLKTHDPGEPTAVNVRFRNNVLYSDTGSFPAAPHGSWVVQGNALQNYRAAPPWTFDP